MSLESLAKFGQNVVNSLLTLARVTLLSKRVMIPKASTQSCVILGNGPSLSVTLANHKEWLSTQYLVAVNHFVMSEAYGDLKPAAYILQAPEFFMEVPPTNMHETARQTLWADLAGKTTWAMTLFVPTQARKSRYFQSLIQIHSNANLHIQYFNPTPVEGFNTFKFHLFNSNWGMPRPHNVLLPAIFLMLNSGMKTIHITGADHSWHETVRVTSDGAQVDHSHFYDKKEDRLPMFKLDGTPYFIHDMFRKWYLAFKGYHELQSYAHYLGATILNASERSYIDAFKRVSFPNHHAQS